MAIRKAYIDWQKLDKDSRLENRKDYMVCMPSSDGTAVLEFATYYDKGTVIDIHMDESSIPTGKETAEEKLLRTLFGARRPFTVPEDGFYVLTGDYGVDTGEYNGSFDGCKEQAICIGDRHGFGETDERKARPAYWAEMPILPEGLSYDLKPQQDKPSPMEEEHEKLWARIESDDILRAAYNGLCGGAQPGDGSVDRKIGEAVYALSTHLSGSILALAWDTCRAIVKVQEQAYIDLREGIAKAKDQDGAMKLFKDFREANGLSDASSALLFNYMDYLTDRAKCFTDHRDRILAEGGMKSLNIPAVLQSAWAKTGVPFRIGRLVKLMRIGAPEIILCNELRVLAEYILAARCGGRIVCVGPNFDVMYGVMPDGSRGKRHCELGDKELYLMEAEPDDDADADEGADAEDAVEMDMPDWLEDEEDGEDGGEKHEPVIGVDYPYFAVLPAPNFLMRSCRYVLWDNMAAKYVRDGDGNVERFMEWQAAKDRADAMAERAKSAAADFADGQAAETSE